MHALQPEAVPEIIACFGMQSWNTGSSGVAAGVDCNAVIRNNLGNFCNVLHCVRRAVFSKTKALRHFW